MSNLENANAKSAEERKRAEMHRTYGMWYKEGATLIISVLNLFIKICRCRG